MIRKIIASLLSAFLFCGIFSITAFGAGKEIEKKLLEIWRSGDEEALKEFYDEHFEGDDGLYPSVESIWSKEEAEAFRNAENKLIVMRLDPDLEEEDLSFYEEYFSDAKELASYPEPFGKYRILVVMEDGTLHGRTIDTRERSVYTVKELVRDFGIDDPSEIGMIRGWIDYGTFRRSALTDYTPGWNEIDGNRYYIKPDGTVQTKSTIIDGIRYKFDESGVCQGKYTGYTMSSKGKQYWKNGELVKNKWIRVNGERKYYADKNGVLVTGTRKIGGKEYSFDENGALKKTPEKKELPRIEVKFPDGAVYESSDGGANWTKDGEEAQRPLVYAAFKGECPLSWSGDACLTIYNGSSVPSLIENGVWFLREENGEWIEAEYLEEVEVLAASAYVIGENAEGRFKIPPELYVPFEGKCRYIHEMRDFDHQIYTVSAEFSIVGESTESVSP